MVSEALAAAVGIEGVVVPQQVVGLVGFRDGMLLVDAFVHIVTAGLPNLYPSWERCVVVHVDLRYRASPVGEYLVYCLHNQILLRLFHRANHTLDKGNLVLVQVVFLVQHLVGPGVGEVLHWDERINFGGCMLCVFLLQYKKPEKFRSHIRHNILTIKFFFHWSND